MWGKTGWFKVLCGDDPSRAHTAWPQHQGHQSWQGMILPPAEEALAFGPLHDLLWAPPGLLLQIFSWSLKPNKWEHKLGSKGVSGNDFDLEQLKRSCPTSAETVMVPLLGSSSGIAYIFGTAGWCLSLTLLHRDALPQKCVQVSNMHSHWQGTR